MKSHHHNESIDPRTKSVNRIHEAIAARAYELWEENGKPTDRAGDFWLEAERELVTGQRKSQRDPALPVSF